MIAIVALAIGVAAPAPAPGALAMDDADLPAVPANTGGPFQIAPPPGDRHVAASAIIGYRGSEGQTTGVIATVSPWGPAFLRLGAEATPTSRGGASRFLWGVGFESPRDDTFYAHLHDWGPVRTDEPFTLRDSEVDAGYKAPRLCAGPLCTAPGAFLLLPLSDRLFGGGRVTVTVAGTWFGAVGLARTIPGVLEAGRGPAAWRMTYILGRSDWRPGSLFVTYSDAFEGARLLDVARTNKPADRQARGVLAAGVSWAY